MLRRLYRALLRMHPEPFRRRFGDEMLWIFDESPNPFRLLADGVISLLRQRLCRAVPDSDLPAKSIGGMPVFAVVDTSGPSRAILGQGAAATVGMWVCLSLVMTAGGARRMPVGLAQIARLQDVSSATAAELEPFLWTKTLKILGVTPAPEKTRRRQDPPMHPPYAGQPLLATPRPRVVLGPADPLFWVLDLNRDSRLSESEIASASKLLLALDADRNGRLAGKEATFGPTFALLDRNGDGELSPTEIRDAGFELRRHY